MQNLRPIIALASVMAAPVTPYMLMRAANAAPLEMCEGAAAEARSQASDTEKVLATLRMFNPTDLKALANRRLDALADRMTARRSRLIADLEAYAADQRETAAALEACPR